MADKWKKRALLVSALAIQDGLFEDYKELATFLELDPSYMWKLIGPDKQRDLMIEVAGLMDAKNSASTINDQSIQAIAGARNIDDDIDEDIEALDREDPDTTDWRREDLDA